MAGQTHLLDTPKSSHSNQNISVFQPSTAIRQTVLKKNGTTRQILSEGDPLPACDRLVIILPDSALDLNSLSRKIWNLAELNCHEVLLMIKPVLEENEIHAQVNLTTLASLIRDSRIAVKTQMVLGISIEKAVSQNIRPKDVLVCFEEHRVTNLFRENRLAYLLSNTTHLPVYTLSGSIPILSDSIMARILDLVLLVLSFISIIGFFALEVWIDQNSTGVFRTISQIVVVCAEVWIIAACSNRSFKI